MAAPAVLLTKGAKLQDAATKQWHPGYLSVLSNKITWQPAGGGAGGPGEQHIGLVSITNMQRAKGKPLLRIVVGAAGYMIEFASEADRESLVDAYTKAKETLQGVKGPGSKSTSPGDTPAPATVSPLVRQWLGRLPTLAQKREMMREDNELAERYNTLVAQAGVLQEDEFWAGVMEERTKAAQAAVGGGPAAAARTGAPDTAPGDTPQPSSAVASAIATVPGALPQRKGLSNAMFQVPVEQDGGAVAMRFTLTPEVIAQVFAEKPHVKRAYQRSVPHQMSEKEFWVRYLKHELSKEEKRKRMLAEDEEAAARGRKAGAGDEVTHVVDHATLFNEEAADPEERQKKRRAVARADPTVNLDADEGETYTGFGLLHAMNKEHTLPKGGFRAVAEDLARNINRHAAVVLSGPDALTGGGQQQPQPQQPSVAAAGPSSSKGGVSAAGSRDPEASASLSQAQQHEEAGGDAQGMDELAAARMKEYQAGLEDLRPAPAKQYQSLDIKETRAYFDRVAAGPDGGNGDMGCGDGVQHPGFKQESHLGAETDQEQCLSALQSVDPNNLACPPLPSSVAYQVLLEVCGLGESAAAGQQEWGAGGARGGPGSRGASAAPSAGVGVVALPPDQVLAPALVSQFHLKVKMVEDVARHFWACIPADTQDKQEKADRLAEHVDKKLWGEVDEFIRTANKMAGPQRPYVRQLLMPVLTMMELLLARHQQDKEQRRAQAAGVAVR